MKKIEVENEKLGKLAVTLSVEKNRIVTSVECDNIESYESATFQKDIFNPDTKEHFEGINFGDLVLKKKINGVRKVSSVNLTLLDASELAKEYESLNEQIKLRKKELEQEEEDKAKLVDTFTIVSSTSNDLYSSNKFASKKISNITKRIHKDIILNGAKLIDYDIGDYSTSQTHEIKMSDFISNFEMLKAFKEDERREKNKKD